jgi:tRNA/tmRNA/rRNA uracil-C5-methylase (TrmA/RlmC/RlmD family)
VAYLACSPGTLARDLRFFEALGFGVALALLER